MTQGEYIKTHPEQFKDEIDKWLFLEFGIIGGCCSAEKSHEYHVARMVAEKLTDAFIKKAEKYLTEKLIKDVSVLAGGPVSINFNAAFSNFLKYMKEESTIL